MGLLSVIHIHAFMLTLLFSNILYSPLQNLMSLQNIDRLVAPRKRAGFSHDRGCHVYAELKVLGRTDQE